SRATPPPRSSSCRWSTTSCAGSRPRGWLKRSRARPSRPRPWSTRRTCGWWTSNRLSAGAAAATSSPPPPRPCAASWWTPPRGGRRAAAPRRRRRARPGGGLRRVDLPDPEAAAAPADDQLLLLDEALTRLAAARPQAAELVRLRFFAGLTAEEAAPAVGLSPRTARRLWAFARAWLRRDMERSSGPAS